MAIVATALELDMDPIRRTPQTSFLYDTRLLLKISAEEAGQIVHASRRSWEGWESGARPMPHAKQDLLKVKLEGLAEHQHDLCVEIQVIDGVQYPMGVVSPKNFVSLTRVAPGRVLLKTLGFDGQPYIRKIELDAAENAHIVKAASRWKSLLDD